MNRSPADPRPFLAIMQGRLSPPCPDRLQAFPWQTWEQEFVLARACGVDGLEWLFEAERFDENPIWTEAGVARIRAWIEATGTAVRTLCAGYFMARPLFVANRAEQLQSEAALGHLIGQSSRIGIETILIPVLETSALRTAADRERLLTSLSRVAPIAEMHGVRLGLETERPADDYLSLVQATGHPAIGAYYDSGNAAARGYDIADDVRRLAPVLCGIHIKDRCPGGPSVPLGEGAADFGAFFSALHEIEYEGPLVLEPAFGPDYLAFARRHVAFVRRHVDEAERHRVPE